MLASQEGIFAMYWFSTQINQGYKNYEYHGVEYLNVEDNSLREWNIVIPYLLEIINHEEDEIRPTDRHKNIIWTDK
jgi:hypothetical protein